MQLEASIKSSLYTALGLLVVTGIGAAGDMRIDTKVQEAIDKFQEQDLIRQQTFYITKQQLSPNSITPDDKINLIVIEKQLEELRSR